MNKNIYIYSKTSENLLFISGICKDAKYTIIDANNNVQNLPVLEYQEEKKTLVLKADSLSKWTPDNPTLYTLTLEDNSSITFGHTEVTSFNNSAILLNGDQIYLRGYIRGIIAHDHPNLTGLSEYEAYKKHISQAKKYGFNLVRFHSTVPSEEFVKAADELGLLIHMEIGFAYEYGPQGKTGISMDNKNWEETILKYRNNPSVAIFCIGNEMHNAGRKPEVRHLYNLGKTLAPAKLIMDNSGWGEYDRTTADIYSQHIAYYFPFKHHQEMFKQDFCWHINGSVTQRPMSVETDGVKVRRNATPLRPVIAHEAIHYIEIPDYAVLAAKYDAFAKKAGAKFLEEKEIEKPRFMTEMPKLIERKNLASKLPSYMKASEITKMQGIKVYLERLRLSGLCGYEMLQFADCFKYENKNGIVDCFDDDKFIPAQWMRQFNSNTVILADFETESFFEDEEIKSEIYLSHFDTPINQIGQLTLKLDGNVIYEDNGFATVAGLQKLIDITFKANIGLHTLSAEFTSEKINAINSWQFRVFKKVELPQLPENCVILDKLTDEVFTELENGKTVLLDYHRDKEGNTYYWPGALDRFKPCIWDRGSNLGGFFNAPWLEETLYGKYFELQMQPLVEGAYKLNLDKFPFPRKELISIVDKPVRDRMKGIVQKIKNFIDDDTLRNFCSLLVLNVGKGVLVVNTFNNSTLPGALNYRAELLKQLPTLKADQAITIAELKAYLTETTQAGVLKEDVMNHFWEIDNKPVEDTLFWEAAGLDLSKIK